jgi:hypothetical protein
VGVIRGRLAIGWEEAKVYGSERELASEGVFEGGAVGIQKLTFAH